MEQTLTPDDLERFVAELAAGRRPTVYLCEAVTGLGLAAGASGKVVSVDSTTVTVKPAGVDDQLPFEPTELRITKQPKPVSKAPAKASAKAPAKAATKAPQKVAPARPASGRPPRSVAITVYVGADNTASLRVTRNAAKPAGAEDIPIAAVHRALAGLGARDAKAAVADVVAAAAAAAASRVADLQAELAAAKKSLAALERAKRTQSQ